jgi:hypothetical protein
MGHTLQLRQIAMHTVAQNWYLKSSVFPLLIIPIIFYHTSINQRTQPAFSLVISLVIPVIFNHQPNQPLPQQIPSFPISSWYVFEASRPLSSLKKTPLFSFFLCHFWVYSLSKDQIIRVPLLFQDQIHRGHWKHPCNSGPSLIKSYFLFVIFLSFFFSSHFHHWTHAWNHLFISLHHV